MATLLNVSENTRQHCHPNTVQLFKYVLNAPFAAFGQSEIVMKKIYFALFCLLCSVWLSAQTQDTLSVLLYDDPRDFEIGGIKVTGADFSDDNAIIAISGLRVGEKIRIPGAEIPRAIKALWKLRLFTSIQILQERTIGDVIFLDIQVQERPRLSRYTYRNIKKSYHTDLNEKLNRHVLKGGIVTDNVKVNAQREIEAFFKEKGFLDARVRVEETPDSVRLNSVMLLFDLDRGNRVKISDIRFVGNDAVKEKKLLKQLSKTKEKKRLFASSKLLKKEYEEDKKKLIKYYNKVGYRDAILLGDSIWRDSKGHLVIEIRLSEGDQYFFRNIVWKGNSIYSSETLSEVLGIEKGDVYNQELLQTRLSFSQEGRDVSTLYMDNGYLFFQADPVEVAVAGDSIDLEIRIFEGPQATIDKVVITGNDRTHEHVIRRELRTLPGEKFSRSDIIRSQREIINLGYFNPEELGINTPVNPDRGTVDIEYKVEEKPSDQLELSAGWGGPARVIGTLGVSFNNFSLRNIFRKEAWHPLPQGDGQRLSLRAQTNGDFFQSYNASFTEPWLGGKKPNSLTVAAFYNRIAYGFRTDVERPILNILQGSVSFGTRLKWPDDNFIASTSINLQRLSLNDWQQGLQVFPTDDGTLVTDGRFNNFSIRQTIARTTINDPIFPREGSRISLTMQITPPYSLFSNKSYADLPPSERFRWVEYHKWRFDAEWYTPIVGKLTLKTSAKIGLLGFYNNAIGTSPFERFQLGGDGINNQQFAFAGVDIISMRGYDVGDIDANIGIGGVRTPTPVFDKFTLELRYPISLNPSSTIFVHSFLQGGNAWRQIRDFNPFDIRRSAGFGVRVFLPMFGVLGFDYGVGFDKDGPRTLQNLARFNIVLGFEPE
ncbi:MAG TPA: outer membrane protein assembly factor BamA [Saprospiraceae bacterium]|nr:outer membrane protein assembly factor BamA [Saprospiraceae bacterium]HMP12528.1 outer membrane protein assembly factor BamA [Saprospiraceae bacterium]